MEFYNYKMFSIDEEKKAKRFAYRHHGIARYCQYTRDGENIEFGYEVKWRPPVYRDNVFYLCNEAECIITEKELYTNYYIPFKGKDETFLEYINACMYSNNGELIEIKNVPKNELIKILRRCYAKIPQNSKTAESDKMFTWNELSACSKYDLYNMLKMYFDDAFDKLVIRW